MSLEVTSDSNGAAIAAAPRPAAHQATPSHSAAAQTCTALTSTLKNIHFHGNASFIFSICSKAFGIGSGALN